MTKILIQPNASNTVDILLVRNDKVINKFELHAFDDTITITKSNKEEIEVVVWDWVKNKTGLPEDKLVVKDTRIVLT